MPPTRLSLRMMLLDLDALKLLGVNVSNWDEKRDNMASHVFHQMLKPC